MSLILIPHVSIHQYSIPTNTCTPFTVFPYFIPIPPYFHTPNLPFQCQLVETSTRPSDFSWRVRKSRGPNRGTCRQISTPYPPTSRPRWRRRGWRTTAARPTRGQRSRGRRRETRPSVRERTRFTLTPSELFETDATSLKVF